MRIGILTGGGDCPGLNAVIRAVVRKGIGEHGDEVVSFRDGWRGALEGDTVPLGLAAVRGLLPRGGTVLAEGTPEDVAAMAQSYTGQYLAPLLEGREARQPKRRASAASAPSAARRSAAGKTVTKKPARAAAKTTRASKTAKR